MTEFSDNPRDCKVEIWQPRENGGLKWYTTVKVTFREGDYEALLEHAFKHALEDALDQITDRQPSGTATPREENERLLRNRFAGMVAICDDPWNKNTCPISLLIPRRWDE